MNKIEIKSIFGNILFTYEAENATIKDAVEKAVKDKVSLRSADLRSANLSLANLRYADLRCADLCLANLRSAVLHYAYLSSANLRSADLRSAKNKETAYLPIFCKWSFSILGDKIQIGCEKRTIENWDLFFASNDELSAKRNTQDFKKIQAVYNACKAYLLTLNQE